MGRGMSDVIRAYAQDVVSRKILAGKYHILCCQRHLRDLERQGTPEFPYRFDLALAERFFRFAELLRHYKGEWAGRPIHLEPWEKFITGSVIGWVHVDTGRRRFRTAFTQIPRKNGKTLIASIVLLYLTFFDGEPGAEGYSVATKRDQAKIVFNDAKRLVESSGLKSRIGVRVSNLHHEASASKLEPLGADHDSTDGLNPSVVVGDEVHAMKDRGMLDVMETATGARRQPVIYLITTFGDDPVSPWGDQNDYSNKILEGVLTDETFFVFTSHADVEDDWTLPETAAKANPNYGISVNPEDLIAKVAKAKGIPSAAAAYKQKHLNLLVNASNPCLSVDGWRKGQTVIIKTPAEREAWLAKLEHESCFVGIDLASKIDLAALSFVFPPTIGRAYWVVLVSCWTPEETLKDRAHRDRAPYLTWVEQGWLTTCPGTRIDHQMIRATLLEHRSRFDIERIGYDPWHVDQLVNDLKADGFAEEQLIEVPQTYQGMSSACLRVQADILAGEMDAGGNPLLAWAVSNVVDQRDGKDNLMFVKKKSRGRIDPVIASTIAVALTLREPAASASVYESRGALVL
jgi:phage terminase large subunit-like protein